MRNKPRMRLFLAGIVCLFYMDAGAVTLDQAIRTALATNPEVLITANERLARDEALRGARGAYLPTLDLIAGIGPQRTDNPGTRLRGDDEVELTRREIGVQATQLLFDGFATTSEISRQKARVASGAYNVYAASELTALRTTEVYLNVIRRQQLLELSRLNLQAHSSIFDQIRSRARAGVGRQSELDQIEGRLELARTNVLNDEYNLQDAETNYFRVLNEMPLDLVLPTPPTSALPLSIDEAIDVALSNHPTLIRAHFDVDAADSQHDAARNGYYPQFDIAASARAGEDLDGLEGRDDELSILLRARWNLYRGGRDRARDKETANLAEEAREIRNRTHRQVIESVRLSWAADQAAQATLGHLRRRVEFTERTRDAYRQQFAIGRRTLLDLLDTENEYTDAKRRLADAEFEGLFAKYRILVGTGQMLNALEIPRPPEAQTDAQPADAPSE